MAASLTGVNPTIVAALISGGWATVVAAVGYLYNRATAKATINATNANALIALDAAHQAQLWEKKSETYVAMLAVLARRGAERQHLTSSIRYDEATEKRIREMYAIPEDFDWAEASSRIVAFAPQQVVEALESSVRTDNEIVSRMADRKALIQRDGSPGHGGITSDELRRARSAIVAAVEAAQAADKKLEALIREDVALKPSERAAIVGSQDG